MGWRSRTNRWSRRLAQIAGICCAIWAAAWLYSYRSGAYSPSENAEPLTPEYREVSFVHGYLHVLVGTTQDSKAAALARRLLSGFPNCGVMVSWPRNTIGIVHFPATIYAHLRLANFAAVSAGFAALFALIAASTARRRTEALLPCPNCGYDLRATPERCPECGTVVARASRP
jgi:predicted RNA-binding Zn-ribbon protein involved in translation (DUF1610 family)